MIKTGIVGYGNVGRAVELAIKNSGDMELAAVFTRRDPAEITVSTPGAAVLHFDEAIGQKGAIDVMILCGGSATDLPVHGPLFAGHFNTVDSFDTHAKIPDYFETVNQAAKDTVSIISVGWDPGLFSMHRLLSLSVLPGCDVHTFWGRGVSQGHSDAVRRIDGVLDAVQYTIPVDAAVAAVRGGSRPALTARDKHLRECYVVLKPGADGAAIEQAIKSMPHYFDEYDTTVHFITLEELREKHSAMAHGGHVIGSGKTGPHSQVMELSLKLDSNPEFTAHVLVAYARAAVRLSREGSTGARTVFDVPLSYLSNLEHKELLRRLL